MKSLLKRISALGLLLLFALSALAFAACDPKPTEPETLVYSVTVVDENNDPVQGVNVMFEGFSQTTGADGKASMELEKGEYTISLSRLPDGYTYSAEIKLDAELHEVIAKLVKGEGEPDPVIPVDPNADRVYTVTVLYPNGDPVTGITVQLCINTLCLTPVPVNAQGRASQTQKPNNYHVKINGLTGDYTYPQDASGYYTGEELTPTKTSITITLKSTAAPENTQLRVERFSGTSETYEVTVNGTEAYAALYFSPSRNGTYVIASDTNVYDAKIGYYAYQYSTASWEQLSDSEKNDNAGATDKNFSYGINIYNDEFMTTDGQFNNQTWLFRIFVNPKTQSGANATFPAKFNITITRTGDCLRRSIVTQDKEIPTGLTKFPEYDETDQAGKRIYQLTPVPVKDTSKVVKGTDGLYRLGTDGPIVTVQLTKTARYYDRALIEFDKEIGGMSGSHNVYCFDITPEADKNDASKPLVYLDYSKMLRGSREPLTGNATSGYAAYVNKDGVCALTDDLMEFLQRFASTYDAKDHIGGLDKDADENSYWLFACYYYETTATE